MREQRLEFKWIPCCERISRLNLEFTKYLYYHPFSAVVIHFVTKLAKGFIKWVTVCC